MTLFASPAGLLQIFLADQSTLIVFAAIFVLGMDFWAWDAVRPTTMGLPVWLFYFVLLSGLQTGAMIWLVRTAPVSGDHSEVLRQHHGTEAL